MNRVLIPRGISVILVTNLVDIDFYVTQTTITDYYDITVNITYATDLIKPTLLANPSGIHLFFFPEELYEGTITITNISNNAPVRNLILQISSSYYICRNSYPYLDLCNWDSKTISA